MIIIGSIIIVTYFIVLGMLYLGYYRIREFEFENKKPTTRFSILIPFRNEALVLPDLLGSIEKLKYSKSLFEIIFIDDESEDNSVELIKNHFKNKISTIQSNDEVIHFKIIKNMRASASPKKDAITTGVELAQYDWILTTDADCILPKDWLRVFDDFIQKNESIMLVGPVQYSTNKGIINQYQQLDNYSLQTTTIGSFGINNPLLCNGANFGYLKEVFNSVEGFSGNNHIASGDDLFLLEKFKKRNLKGIHFIKNKHAIIITRPQNSWKKIIRQRIRWTSKTSKQNNTISILLGLIVFLSNLFVFLGALYSLFESSLFPYYISFLFLKILLDYLFLRPTESFYKTKISIPIFLVNAIIYPIITIIVVFSTLGGSYTWKGRSFKK